MTMFEDMRNATELAQYKFLGLLFLWTVIGLIYQNFFIKNGENND